MLGIFTSGWNSNNERKRMEAIEKIIAKNDEKKLRKIANKSNFDDVICTILDNTNDEEFLIDTIGRRFTSFSDSTREKIFEKINDEEFIINTISRLRTICSESVFEKALEKISDEKILASIVKDTEYNIIVREKALEKISDEKILADIVKHSTYFASKDTIKKINDKNITGYS